jgi:HME family heavy-metal exporter
MRRLGEHDSWLVRKLKAGNDRVLRWAFGHRSLVLGLAAGGVALAAATVPFLPRTFLPPFNEGTVVISLTYQPGISLAQSSALGQVAERLLLDIPEVKGVGRRTGRAELDEHAEGVHSSELDLDIREGGRPRARCWPTSGRASRHSPHR